MGVVVGDCGGVLFDGGELGLFPWGCGGFGGEVGSGGEFDRREGVFGREEGGRRWEAWRQLLFAEIGMLYGGKLV